ncbi:MAG: hypothetical protein NC040_10520 [Muribaculaceae bacterium]|nr:hypothetical protein [Alistipes senegalensis]MCM1474485.1 hypothetical protein [Muribaculaceae bacterium]
MAKIERKLLAHFLNATPTKDSASYYRLGKDLEEYSVELSAESETKKNILGEVSTVISSYEATGGVEPYYADKNDEIYAFLKDIIDNRKVFDDVKTDTVEVHLWESVQGENGENSTVFVAYKETAVIEVTSYGGDTTGYQIPFTVHYQGDRVKGKFDISTKTFTQDNAVNVG